MNRDSSDLRMYPAIVNYSFDLNHNPAERLMHLLKTFK